MAGKDMPSLEVRANRGGRPPLSSRDRELGRDGSPGAILGKAPPVPTGGAFLLRLDWARAKALDGSLEAARWRAREERSLGFAGDRPSR